jgi:hypothetical protein
MQVSIENRITELRKALINGEYSLPNNTEELKSFCDKLGWPITTFNSIRKSLFPTDEENAALSAKFMKMI